MNEIQEINRIIRERRSTFTPMMTGDKIPDEIVLAALENATWAPNHKKTEPWRFYLIQDKALQRLSDYSVNWYLENTPKEKITDRKLKKTKNNALLSSHVVAICLRRDPEESIPEWEEISAVAMAVQNLWLTISEAGYGGYWSTPKYALEIDGFLNLREGEKCYGFFYIGQPHTGLELKGKRTALNEKLKMISK